jgi:hypothetical protein
MKSKWFEGPDFLQDPQFKPIIEVKPELLIGDPEVKIKSTCLKTITSVSILDKLKVVSSWTMLKRAVARLQRRAKGIKCHKESTLEEQHKAALFILMILQKDTLPNEAHNSLNKLNPITCEDGLLRVGGRLQNSSLQNNVKHPIILPKGHFISRLIIDHYHKKIYHQGRGMTLNEIRMNGPPFYNYGMDCFGPFLIKEGRKEIKRYGLIITCLASRAIHIEMLDDLTSDAFINALRCFLALRGPVKSLRSDQGTNFIGARNEIKSALKEVDPKLRSFLMKEECEFVFNPPSASHRGGSWERQIRTV